MKFRSPLVLALAIVSAAPVHPAAASAPFAFTAPGAASTLLERSSGAITWTGGDAAWKVNLSLIDVAAFTVVASVASGITNSGALNWTFASSLACGKDYQFYIENTQRTSWTYGPKFTLKCLPSGSITIKTPPPAGSCTSQFPVTGLHYPNQTCAQTTAGFLANWMTMVAFKSKCAAGSVLLGVTSVSCQDAPIPGFPNGSVYAGTACCGLKLSATFTTSDSYNAVFTAAQVQVFARNRADAECKSKFGASSVAANLVVTHISSDPAKRESYDDRSFNCVLP